MPSQLPTISPVSSVPTKTPTDAVVASSAGAVTGQDRNIDPNVPCKVEAEIGCKVKHMGNLIDCGSFSKSNEDSIEIQWTYTIINGCSSAIIARRAMIMKCHKCPAILTNNGPINNGPNQCSSDINFFREATGDGSALVDGMSSYELTEVEEIDLTKICDMSLLVSSFSRFIAARIGSADGTEEVANTQVTAVQALGPVCRASTEVWPGMKGCQSENVWGDAGAVGGSGGPDDPTV